MISGLSICQMIILTTDKNKYIYIQRFIYKRIVLLSEIIKKVLSQLIYFQLYLIIYS